LLLVKTFVGDVQLVPAAAVATRGPLLVSGPWIDTLPPTSTFVVAPVIAPLSRMQRSPRVPTFVTNVMWSIVRHEPVLSW
jgi:hypothetical protein